jgi:cytochrome b subunit of formate dehydrogenase
MPTPLALVSIPGKDLFYFPVLHFIKKYILIAQEDFAWAVQAVYIVFQSNEPPPTAYSFSITMLP